MPEKPDPGVDPGEKEDPTDDPNPSVAVVKEVTSTPANGESYALGETISYRVTVTNDGNVPVENIRVEGTPGKRHLADTHRDPCTGCERESSHTNIL